MIFLLFSAVLNNQKKPLPSLKALFTVVEEQDAIEDVNRYAQEHWLRPADKERFQLNENSKYEKYNAFILYHLKKLGMIDEVVSDPHVRYYDYVVLHGATIETMKNRIQFFKKMCAHVRYKQIIFLTGNRLLFESENTQRKLWGVNTECDAAKYLMKKSHLNHYYVVNAKKLNGSRPNTKDTVDEWMKAGPKPGTVLAVSNNPYIQRQDLTLKNILVKYGFKKEDIVTIGYKALPNKVSLSVFFDELARLIYTESQS